jgi:hypothetical protein
VLGGQITEQHPKEQHIEECTSGQQSKLSLLSCVQYLEEKQTEVLEGQQTNVSYEKHVTEYMSTALPSQVYIAIVGIQRGKWHSSEVNNAGLLCGLNTSPRKMLLSCVAPRPEPTASGRVTNRP